MSVEDVVFNKVLCETLKSVSDSPNSGPWAVSMLQNELQNTFL